MTRALWFFALLVAFVVAGARCLSAFPSATLAADERAGSAALSQVSHAPSDQDPATGGTIEDDSDDSANASLLPSPSRLRLAAPPAAVAGKLSVLCQQGPLQSHTLGLDRPPRA